MRDLHTMLAILLILFAWTGHAAFIKHGDLVSFRDLVIANKDGRAYRRPDQPGTLFQVFKAPFYKSPNDTIMSGKTVVLTVANGTKRCEFESTLRTMVCSPVIAMAPTVRILDKHGADNKPLEMNQLVKLRMAKVNIDCSAYGKQPLSCLIKKPQETYGFVLQ